MYWMFSSVSTLLLDCLFLSQNEHVIYHFLTSFHTHNFVGTHSCGYLLRASEWISVKFSFFIKYSTVKTFCWIICYITRIMNEFRYTDLSKQNFHSLPYWLQYVDCVNDTCHTDHTDHNMFVGCMNNSQHINRADPNMFHECTNDSSS